MKKYIMLLISMISLLSSVHSQGEIVKMEYWINQDPGLDLATQITGFTSETDVMTYAYSFINDTIIGTHLIGVRAMDSMGVWSHTSFSTVEVIAEPLNPVVQRGEYWIDKDPGLDSAFPLTAITPSNIVTSWVSSISLDNITPLEILGNHIIGYRAIDDHGKWSHTNFGRLRVVAVPDSAKAIAAVEFYWDTDDGFGVNTPIVITLPEPVNPMIAAPFAVPVPASFNEGETHDLFVRTQDTDGTWSHTSQSLDSVTIYPLATDTLFTTEMICDSITTPSGTVIMNDTIFSETVLTDNEFQVTTYDIQLVIVDTSIDSTDNVLQATVEDGYLYQWLDCNANNLIEGELGSSYTVTESGDYAVQLTSPEGCEATSECIEVIIVSIEEHGEMVFQYYPNPVTDELFVSVSNGFSVNRIKILAMNGQVVLETALDQGLQNLDVSAISAGTYVLELKGDQKMVREKLVIN